MWVFLFLTVGLMAWVSFIHAQYRYGDRPTNLAWYAVMMSLGTFEYTKGMFGLVQLGVSPLPVALLVAVLTGVVVFLAAPGKVVTVEQEVPRRVLLWQRLTFTYSDARRS